MPGERELMFSRALNVAVVGVLLLVLAGGASKGPAQNLVVKSVQVVDSRGRARLTLSIDDRDQPLLQMLDRNGSPVVSLDLGLADEPTFALNGDGAVTQLSLSLANGDLPWLQMYGKHGEPIVDLGLNSYGAPSLELSDLAYRRHADIRFDQMGYFGLAVYGPEYEDRLRVGLTSFGNPAVELFGADEERRASLDLEGDRPNLTLWDDDGRMLLTMPTYGRDAPGPSD